MREVDIQSLGSLIEETLGPLIGVSMKDACTRAMAVALDMRFTAEAREKGVKADGRTDWVTDADLACQRIFVKLFTEQWVESYGFGLIGEEDGLNIPCQLNGENIYWTVDPIDGTSAYKRRQSGGFGPMCALVCDGKVLAVCVGDANSGKLYYYRPGSPKTHRLVVEGRRKKAVELKIDPTRPLADQFVQIRSLPSKHSSLAQEIILGGLFLDAETANDSIGLSEARRWKGEVGGTILRQRKATPWDDTPIIGMDRRLGFDTFQILPESRLVALTHRDVPFATIEVDEPREGLIIHRSRREELAAWCTAHNVTFQANELPSS